jgi:hypothetical protein
MDKMIAIQNETRIQEKQLQSVMEAVAKAEMEKQLVEEKLRESREVRASSFALIVTRIHADLE